MRATLDTVRSLSALLSSFAAPALVFTALVAGGCSSTSTGDPSAPQTSMPPPPPPADPEPEAPAAPQAPKKAPTTVADCTNLVTDIVNDPPLDGGVAMNNATTAGDAGASDRLVPVMEAIQKDRDAFRCCFDLWGKDHAGEQSKIALVIELDPDGTLKTSSFKQAETDLKDAAVEACMVDVTKKMSFPPSPSGKETTYTHRFEFKARAFAR